MIRTLPFMAVVALVPVVAWSQEPPRARGVVGNEVPAFTVRPGYRVTLVAKDLGEARFLAFDTAGTLYVSQPNAGSILALKDIDGDGTYEYAAPFVEDKPKVQAMQFVDGWLWFATTGGVFKARDADNDGTADDVETVIAEGTLPGNTGHWWRSLLVTKDAFYTSVGDSANVSDETNTDRQKIWRFDHAGGNKTLYCTGIRNTEKLQLRPGTDEIWGCDHGSDNFGLHFGETKDVLPVTDLNPPDEFNHYVEGGFYGHPFIVGTRLPRAEYADRKDIVELAAKTTPPEWAFGAHWAINGWTFLSRDAFPGHKGDAVVAAHGSWNSSKKVGYRIQRVLFDPWTGKPYGSQMLVSTLSPDGTEVLARPCDVVEAPDGSLLFSSDSTNCIFRISHEKVSSQ